MKNIDNIMTFLDLARKYPTMRRILAINRRKHLNKEWQKDSAVAG